MSLTENTLSTPAGGTPATAGIDWAKDDYAVCVLDSAGDVVQRVTLTYTKTGLSRLTQLLTRHSVHGVGIERADGPIIDALLHTGHTIYVIPPSQIKALRRRYGSAGNKDDRFDAYVLADTVRTDRRRLTPLLLDSEPTTALRKLCRARKDMVTHRVALANQLRAHLSTALPAAVDLFRDIDSAVSRAFLTRFTTQDAVDWLSSRRLAVWLAGVSYSGRTDPARLYAQISTAPRGATGEHGQALAGITRAYLATLAAVTAQISALTTQITDALDAHPDKDIFIHLPRAGTVRAARMLAEIGNARGRFPTAASLACLAGVAPSTRESGKARVVAFRWAVDKQLRDAICDFAGDSRHKNPWAANLYTKARDRGHDHPHAVRILARAWTDIIWKCWTTNTAYNPDRHRALQQLLNQDQKTGG
ncbi:IS110 family transposase [Dactylosporangium matsuzakiense]|uniref:IS110 family transposase n=1 Tax=Dactylosporangium matsuzakiense TaxID=53360 RepID=A0A9W6KX56_9ACTN|nr:IS110 family transposase [Dactylosporangium matsuzakiense]UWZ41163.1 IS110 family transposase [Dactylosporangium matsuzakiense]UWZ42728.1 IS110 family transposase [Dactylosporangium matsuzakiense]UWZ43757.1 IS110 family transposase [Dactylosporangium matsuzakiense]UWZ45884.1 IS110 family transposase [Dactylosporangium matsuzakiense]UWZ45990.1 IS110 family transposase [Dactylosporangium matsuzakiense]